MKKILILITVIIYSAFIGAGIFSFVVAEKLYFPTINKVAIDTKAGLSLMAYQYSPWFWNREKVIIINIEDRKNDAPNVEYKLKGEIYSIRLIHSGEDFALIAYNDSNPSMESGYVVHRSPKSESENTIEEIKVGGNIIAVTPDESGFFYISGSKIFKKDWQGNIIMSAELGTEIDLILDIQQMGIEGKMSNQPVLFFSNNAKMAFFGTTAGERWSERHLFIWNLENNIIDKISGQDLGNYNDLIVENDKLYIERLDRSSFKKLIAE